MHYVLIAGLALLAAVMVGLLIYFICKKCKMNSIIFLVIIFILSISLLSLLASVLVQPLISCRPEVKLDDLKTGDIVLVTFINRRYVLSIAGIQTGHAMMAVRNGKKLYLTDLIHEKGKLPKDCHPRLIDAKEYFNSYYIYASVRSYEGPPIPFIKVMKAMRKFKNKYINLSYAQQYMYHHYTFTTDLRDPDVDGVSCAEYIYLMLCEMGVVSMNRFEFTDSFRFLEKDAHPYSKLSDIVNGY